MTKIEKCEPPSTAAKVEITSLNSHFWPKHPCPKVWWLDLKSKSVN